MNKNLKNTIINKFPIVSILVLILIYIYLNLPNDINSILNPKQIGGKPAYELPPFTPWLYKYRFAFVVLPILLLLLLIYYIYYSQVVVPSYSMWDMGHNFFSNYQKQTKNLVKGGYTPVYNTYKNLPDAKAMEEMTPDEKALINILQLTQDPLSGVYTKAQYFCNAARPCNCCKDDLYVKQFFNCPSASSCNNAAYNQICNPKKSTPSK